MSEEADEAERERERQDDKHYEHHLAAEIVAMLPYARDAALRVLTLAHAILNLPVGEPEGETPS
jgi:hypothetical protein